MQRVSFVSHSIRKSGNTHVPEGGDEHRALRDGVVVGHGESLLDEVGDHEDGRAMTENLASDGVGVGHLLEPLKGDGRLGVVSTNGGLLGAELGEDLGVVGKVLETEGEGRGHGVCWKRKSVVFEEERLPRLTLGSEDEGEKDKGHLMIGVLAEDEVGPLSSVVLVLVVVLGGKNGLNPSVKQAVSLGARGHALLGGGGGIGKVLDGNGAGAASVPDLGSGEGCKRIVISFSAVSPRESQRTEGEVDELESLGDLPVLGGDLTDALLGDVIAAEDTKRGLHVDVAEDHPVGLGLGVRVGEPALEGGAVDAVLDFEVDTIREEEVSYNLTCNALRYSRESLGGEQAVESLAILVVNLSIEEDPV